MLIEFHPTALQVVQLLIAVVLPLLVGLVTTRTTSAGLKAVLLAALSAVSALLTSLAAAIETNQPYDLAAALFATVMTFLVAVGMHFGIYKPTGASVAVQNVGALPPADPGNPTQS